MICLPVQLMAQGAVIGDSCFFDVMNLDEIVVTGTRVRKLLKDTPVQTRLITSKEIEQSDATDIGELLQNELPGVEFSYAMNQQTHMNFGGFGGQSVLFLVDGERLAGETLDDIDFQRIDMNNVERIEIVRGASSALYGSNACGGVINVITKEASKKVNLDVDVRIGRHNEQRYIFGLRNKVDKIQNSLSATASRINTYDVKNAPDAVTAVVNTVFGHKTLNIRDQIVWRPMSNIKLSGKAGFYMRELLRETGIPDRYRAYSGVLKGEWNVTESDAIELCYAFDQYDKSRYNSFAGMDILNYRNVQNSVRALFNRTFSDRGVLTVGADYMRDYLMNTKLAGSTKKQDCADVFLQYDWTVSNRWEVVGALRYDYFSDGHLSRTTPKISARYQPVPTVNLRMSYGLGFRAPSLKEKYYEFDMAGIWIVKGNPTLKPETSHNVNLSADYTVKQYNFTIAAYYNHIRNKITTGLPYYLPGDMSQLYLNYVNLDDFNSWGAEITAQAAWSNGFSAKISYAFTYEENCKHKEQIGNQFMPTRPHALTARISWERTFSRDYKLQVGLNGRFLSSVSNLQYKDYYDLSSGTTTVDYPAYTLWKLTVAQTFFRKLKLTVALDNLFNYRPRYYYLNAPMTEGVNALVSASITL